MSSSTLSWGAASSGSTVTQHVTYWDSATNGTEIILDEFENEFDDDIAEMREIDGSKEKLQEFWKNLVLNPATTTVTLSTDPPQHYTINSSSTVLSSIDMQGMTSINYNSAARSATE